MVIYISSLIIKKIIMIIYEDERFIIMEIDNDIIILERSDISQKKEKGNKVA